MAPSTVIMRSLIFFLLVLVSPLAAQTKAKVLELKGEAKVVRNLTFKVEAVSKGTTLAVGDTVRTGDNTLLHLEMEGERIALIKSNARFRILSDRARKHRQLNVDVGEFLIGAMKKSPRKRAFPSALLQRWWECEGPFFGDFVI